MAGKALSIMLGAVLLLLWSVSPYGAEPLGLSIGQAYGAYRCKDAIARHLESSKVEVDETGKIRVLSNKSPKGRTLGYRAWVPLKSCRGSLIINFTRHCHFLDTYTSGECRLDEIKQ